MEKIKKEGGDQESSMSLDFEGMTDEEFLEHVPKELHNLNILTLREWAEQKMFDPIKDEGKKMKDYVVPESNKRQISYPKNYCEPY